MFVRLLHLFALLKALMKRFNLQDLVLQPKLEVRERINHCRHHNFELLLDLDVVWIFEEQEVFFAKFWRVGFQTDVLVLVQQFVEIFESRLGEIEAAFGVLNDFSKPDKKLLHPFGDEVELVDLGEIVLHLLV